ncbi:crossover junction endodeoxyribonuclease RuvC [Streptomyces sp. WA6-1-16]|nr:crossover junction endodeoxyribonuclease RuvC [Streptomyces sp. BF-3]UCA50174.1 crossover junction endodeoxyribonuclease RuvC [Streptomyces sp. WA6-1-16]
MRVLGVDPGLTRCGVGVVEGVAGRPLTMLGVGVVRTPSDAELGDRLVAVERGIEAWLDEYSPGYVAVERVFAQHNVRTVMGTAQASAIAMLCAARRGIPVALHTPSEVKAAVTGSGRAEKAQVGAMVTRLLRLDAPPRPADAADALALAICHIWRAPAQNRLQQAVAAHRTPSASRRQTTPGISRTPGASATPRTPGASATPRTPGASATPRTPGASGATGASGTPRAPGATGTSGIAPAPGASAAPRTSGASRAPRTLKGRSA